MRRLLNLILILIIILILATNIFATVHISLDKDNLMKVENNDQQEKEEQSQINLSSPKESNKTKEAKTTKKDVPNITDILLLANKEHHLPSDYKPTDLVQPNIPFLFKEDLPKKLMRKEAALALEELFNSAKKDTIKLFGVSGYRSYYRQKQIFDYKAQRLGEEVANKTVAYPGQSEHQTGLAMDVSNQKMGFKLHQSFGNTREGIWIANNAPKFGFIIRYPKGKEHITGYKYEPWHLRYVGIQVAQEIAQKGITLEEYFGD
ncbi:MAG: M15 family metallopeptidase [Halanaerobiales bacterium]|nr:M15 family metallopeptidase [Halanaerobiales bacterium]